jgi:negative regulator of flagellin synthesis FlgM
VQTEFDRRAEVGYSKNAEQTEGDVAMQIDKNNPIHIDAYVNQVQDKNKAAASGDKPERTPTLTDTVVISDTAKRIQEARKLLDDMPDIREDKVAQLKRQIENGTYDINAEKIADKMIKEGLVNDLVR